MVDSNRELSKFSVINTEVKLFKDKDGQKVRKYVISNVDLGHSVIEMQGWIREYIERMLDAGMPLPDIHEDFIENEKIVFICKFAGKNVSQIYPEVKKLLENSEILKKVSDIISRAQDNSLWIDPHPKNFVVEDNVVSFVDFSPPYQIEEYRSARLAVESNPVRYDIVVQNFNVFRPENLFYHFVGDFFKLTSDISLIGDIYKTLQNRNLVHLDIDAGLDKAKSIREIEDLKFKHNIFLM